MVISPDTYMGRRTVHFDGTDTPQTSPVASVGTTPVEIKVPAGGVVARFKGVDYGIRIGEDADLSEGYETCLVSEWSNIIPVQNGHSLFVRIDETSGTTGVEFTFEIA